MKFKVIRENGIWHTYEYEYQKSPYYCINCGSDEVYSDVKQTEFYEGRQHVCLKCECTFFIPLEPEKDQESLSFVKQIRSQLKQMTGRKLCKDCGKPVNFNERHSKDEDDYFCGACTPISEWER